LSPENGLVAEGLLILMVVCVWPAAMGAFDLPFPGIRSGFSTNLAGLNALLETRLHD